ncbi:2-methylthioadenine synthetase [Bacillus pseudomycoides]|uniref:SAVED domain-containing protein n=1 Tax=Bacillus pseudomycoides TaxID=64104 RepID=UPI000BEB7FD7|nr:SAVED domain-containing protein [Bacillus pseudomycoides]PEF72930.1 2-methylthioadenine synthetase [Bacillus pseudomycoides]PEL81115.1 2-methylthioadenine synthetase [Bacillus pseudomycoides]PGE94211.1 2-methylthioadenine synthetase [Bacillus pseudomycoides]PHB30989.1 2-methylthioadenine synthetase [Bacillus pseudomycoides]PHE27382.1 2-methylthioadenine synthetase [Bacillus pseudomycoides]
MVLYIVYGILGVIFLFGAWKAIRAFFDQKKEQSISYLIITVGINLIIASFGGKLIDKWFSYYTAVSVNASKEEVLKNIDKVSDLNIPQFVSGGILLALGIYLLYRSNQKSYILNINGYFDNRIENHTKDLGLTPFDFKEREIDIIRLHKKGIDSSTTNEILDIITDKVEKFRNESKTFKRGYTGIAPIPFIMFAGTCFPREKIDDFYEFYKFEDTYKILDDKKSGYPLLHVTTNINELNERTREVVLTISTTVEISSIHTNQFNAPIVQLSVNNTDDNIITSKNQLKEYGEIVYETIKAIQLQCPHVETIHILYAGQSCLAFKIGQLCCESTRMTKIINYQYIHQSDPKYPWGIVMNGDEKGKYIKYSKEGESEYVRS